MWFHARSSEAIMRTSWMRLCITMLVWAILGQIYMFYILLNTDMQSCKKLKAWSRSTIPCALIRQPRVLLGIPKKGNTTGLVGRVFSRLGYKMIEVEKTMKIEDIPSSEWDVLWTHMYPYHENAQMARNSVLSKINTSQKINHFPGIGILAVKAALMKLGCRYVPKTFEMPTEKSTFLKYVQEHRNENWWIQKNRHHRGNEVRRIEDLDMDKPILVQKFIHNQFLLHGHAINIGVNVIITSASPLRAYILDGSWLIRICSNPYNSNDFSDNTTYITDGDHMDSRLFEFEPMKKYFDLVNYSRKQALKAHVIAELGRNPDKIERQLKDAIEDGLRKGQGYFSHDLMKRKNDASYGNIFFEVMRWDFIMDEDLNIHFIEVNMSPDISSDSPLIREKNEQLIFGSINTIGYSHGNGGNHRLRNSNVYVDRDICWAAECNGCIHQDCKLCSNCLSADHLEMLKVSYIEHINRHSLRRVYPPSMTHADANSYNEENDKFLPEADRVNQAWFRHKCVQDAYWCT